MQKFAEMIEKDRKSNAEIESLKNQLTAERNEKAALQKVWKSTIHDYESKIAELSTEHN